MATYTEHYQLHQWQPEDPFLRTDFNQDLQKIDASLNNLYENSEALKQAINQCGNCILFTGTYLGTGLNGQDNPCSFVFPSKPEIVLLFDSTGSYKMIIAYGQTEGFAEGRVNSENMLLWKENILEWYCGSTDMEQLNVKNRTYYVCGLIEAGK